MTGTTRDKRLQATAISSIMSAVTMGNGLPLLSPRPCMTFKPLAFKRFGYTMSLSQLAAGSFTLWENIMALQTHEKFIAAVASYAIKLGDLNPTERAQMQAVKMVYGSGPAGTRGVTYFQRWKPSDKEESVPFVELCAFGQESIVQLCGTTIHELGHVPSRAWRGTQQAMG